MNEKIYAVFDVEDLIASKKNGFELGNYNFWYCDSKGPASFEGANIMLSRKQVIALLEWSPELTGKNVYEFTVDNYHQLDGTIDMFKIATAKAAATLENMGDYSNAELIEKLRNEEDGDDLKVTEDAVKRPSHYMLQDGTEVKNHIRSILGDEGFKSWAIGNAVKYVSRYKDKGKPIQDLKKAQENIQMVIDVLGEQDDLD